jgi:hypothetical protein
MVEKEDQKTLTGYGVVLKYRSPEKVDLCFNITASRVV